MLCILVAVTLPLAVAAVILAWAEGNLRNAIVWGALTMAWNIGALHEAWKVSRRQRISMKQHSIEVSPRRRRMMVFARSSGLFIFAVGVIGLVTGLIINTPMYLILEAVWIIIVGGGLLLFFKLWPYE